MLRRLCLLLLLPACGPGDPGEPAAPQAIQEETGGAAARASSLALLRLRHAGRNVQITVDPQGVAQNEPALSCNPGRRGNVVVTVNDYRQPGVLQSAGAAYASFDGGQHFGFSGLLPGLTVQSGGSYEGAGNSALSCGGDGACSYAAMVYDRTTSRSGIATGRSTDGGRSFTRAQTVVADNDAKILHDKPAIAIDPGTGPLGGKVYLAWTRFLLSNTGDVVSSPIYLSRSTDGQRFDAPRQISPAPFDQNQGATLAIDGRGRLYIAYQYYPLGAPGSRHVIQWSDDGGGSFSAPQQIGDVVELPLPIPPARYRTNSFPSLAIDPVSGALLVAWADNRAGAADVLLAASFDRGQRFTAPVRINDNGARAQHVFPVVACGAGRCGVSFYSTRDDPGGVRLSYYYAPVRLNPRGMDGGSISRGPNLRVSDILTDPGAQLGGQYIGDYTALCLDRYGAHPAWTDTRNSHTDDTGRTIVHQDVYTAVIPPFLL